MSRLLLGYGEDDFNNIFVSNILQIDDENSLDDYTFSTNDSSELEMKKGATVISTFSPIGITFSSQFNISSLGDIAIGTNTDTQVYIGDPIGAELKLRSVGNAHFSLFNNNGLFQFNNTSTSGNMGITGTNLLTIDSTGNVGIGTNNPSVLLEISKDDDTNGQLLVRPASTTGADGIITIRGARNSNIADSNSKLIFENYDNDITTTSVMGRIGGIVNNATTNIGDLAFYNYADGINGAESMRLTSGGLMGMGVPIPSYLIDLKRTTGALLKMTVDATNSAGNMIINSTRTGVGNVGILSFQTNDNAISQVKGYLTDVANDYGDLRFFTKGSGGLNQKMIIDEDGNVGIGTLNPSIDLAIKDDDTGLDLASAGVLLTICSGTPMVETQPISHKIYNTQSTALTAGIWIHKNAVSSSGNHFMNFYRSSTSFNNGVFEGSIRTNSSGNIQCDNTSDERLKENIITYDRGIDKIRAMRIVEYNWIDPQRKAEIGTIVGVIAQEYQLVLPKAVSPFEPHPDNPDQTSYLGISMSELIPFSISAIKNVDERLIEAEAKILTLEAENTLLKTQMIDVLNRLDLLEIV